MLCKIPRQKLKYGCSSYYKHEKLITENYLRKNVLAELKLKDGRIGTQKFLNERHLVLFAAFFGGGGGVGFWTRIATRKTIV